VNAPTVLTWTRPTRCGAAARATLPTPRPKCTYALLPTAPAAKGAMSSANARGAIGTATATTTSRISI
jgi:hypothetical protein